ncbi:MAG: hypothetical protein DRI40_05815 [Chloroflexi bacterium]|nr:MAG: hypothetical protein DRI40_05815 [Chloroflexota bacterium]
MPTNRRLIEEWLPIQEIAVGSRRERAVSSALPPLYLLHVLGAWRSLIGSRHRLAEGLGAWGLVPAWDLASVRKNNPSWPRRGRSHGPARDVPWARQGIGSRCL